METVILAAGRNERLRGIVAPYHKPLLVVNGKPLIGSIFDIATRYTKKVSVVCAPQNVESICQVLSDSRLFTHEAQVIIQPEARGPGEALLRGLMAVEGERAIVLCADNLFDEMAYARVRGTAISHPDQIIVGGRIIQDPREAERFTRISPDGLFIEGMPGGRSDAGYYCWLGPLIVPVYEMKKVLQDAVMKSCGQGEIKIASNLNLLKKIPYFVCVDAYDIGEPLEVERKTSNGYQA